MSYYKKLGLHHGYTLESLGSISLPQIPRSFPLLLKTKLNHQTFASYIYRIELEDINCHAMYTFLFILLSSLLSHIHSCYFSILYLCTSQSAFLIVYRTATYLSKDPERPMTHQSVQSLNRVRLLATPWTAAYQAPASMGFSRQEYWSGVPLPSPIQPKLRVQQKLLFAYRMLIFYYF